MSEIFAREGACRQCGHCCQNVFIQFNLPGNPPPECLESARDYLTWVSYHDGLRVQEMGEGSWEIRVPSTCRHLLWQAPKLKGGVPRAVCAIYDNRPQVCREFPVTPSHTCPGFTFRKATPEEIEKLRTGDEHENPA